MRCRLGRAELRAPIVASQRTPDAVTVGTALLRNSICLPGARLLSRPLAIGVMMSAHTTSRLSGRSHSLGAAPTLLRCDHCRGELGLGVHRYWHMQFCSSTCMAAYQQRLAPETKEKICRFDVPSEDQTSGSNLPQPRVSWPALWGFDFHSIF